MCGDDTDQTPDRCEQKNGDPMVSMVEELLEAGSSNLDAQERLEQLLRDDDYALREYLALMDVDARLRWTFRGGVGALPTGLEAAKEQEYASDRQAEAVDKSTKTVAGAAERPSFIGSRRRSIGSVWRWAGEHRGIAAGLAASLAAVLVLWTALKYSPDSGVIGTLAQSAAADWAEPHAALASGEAIRPGELTLISGIAEIALRDGTRLIIEGPATLDIRSVDKAFLKSGTISVFVGGGAAGYTLETPDARVVDLGTAFQTRIVALGTEVHVIEGEVLVSANCATARVDSNELRLSARDAVRFNRNGGVVEAIPFVGEQLKLHGSAALSAIPYAVTGDIRCLDHPPESVVVGEFEHDDVMYLFLEQSDVVLERTLYADRNSKGEIARKDGNLKMTIPKGSRATSYLLHFDPTTKLQTEPKHRVSGTITFRSPIAGVFFTSPGLHESDKYLRSTTTRYSQPKGARTEKGESQMGANRSVDDGDDFVAFSPDRKTIFVNLQANWAADEIRIVTTREAP